MESKNPKKSKRKFKQTKQLVKLALNNGWTQPEIAEACRTQQSVVSAWANGKKQGTEQQLKPLLDIFGHKLRRNSFGVYWSIDSGSQEKTYHKVEGNIILNQELYQRKLVDRRIKKFPMYKLVIHYQGGDEFRLVYQSRHTSVNTYAELMTEDIIWDSKITERYKLPELIIAIDKYAKRLKDELKTETTALPLIARQALLNYGFDIEGVVEYPAVW
ncbi:helix-turn-helix transcriptional regulator [Psychromonas sp. Urea-02u-13]|uniref:helix-turn-helix transcriptional regulator n=1 Tax=Psychromonas sp. Urea-02u-13 TaxID=2058326 RepID=UPI000C34A071|nr:helix-turn-helix transcriptional regulator [Psychromonas sp. Urea-02u-13]PKG37111.1 hypothetical protein CXF74_20620 [Psychromonas sp. Urea-02u-13]